METLENRYYCKEKPYLWILAKAMPNASADVFRIRRLDRDMDRGELVKRLITEPVDAVYTDIYDTGLLYSMISMGLVLYLPERYGKSWPVKKFGTTVYTMGGVPKDRCWEILERAMDICIGTVGLGAAAVVYPFIAPAIRKQSGGSPLYSQIRIGYNGRPFRMYKFRSMKADADLSKESIADMNEMDGHMFKIWNDPRITKIGKYIRKTSIDELPQFLNVLKGDMSVIGTRPPLPEEVRTYEARHKVRLAGKPGITGAWQSGGRNKIRNFDDVVAMDWSYLRDPSPERYLYLVLRTVERVIRHTGDGQ